jgi:hypothetical protein
MGVTLRRAVQILESKGGREYRVTRRPGVFVIEWWDSLAAILTPQQFIWLRRNKIISEDYEPEFDKTPGKYRIYYVE